MRNRSDSPPKTQAEYDKRAARNMRITGFGADVVSHVPCPFCAAPDFWKLRIIAAAEDMAQEQTCKECGRSAKALVSRSPGSVGFEMVQTGGDDQPEWLQPKMRRV